jgi:hypothetical protein
MLYLAFCLQFDIGNGFLQFQEFRYLLCGESLLRLIGFLQVSHFLHDIVCFQEFRQEFLVFGHSSGVIVLDAPCAACANCRWDALQISVKFHVNIQASMVAIDDVV